MSRDIPPRNPMKNFRVTRVPIANAKDPIKEWHKGYLVGLSTGLGIATLLLLVFA